MTTEGRLTRLEENDAATREVLADLLEGQRALQDTINEQFGDGRADIKDLQKGQRRLDRKVDDVRDDVKELKMGMRMVLDRLEGMDKR